MSKKIMYFAALIGVLLVSRLSADYTTPSSGITMIILVIMITGMYIVEGLDDLKKEIIKSRETLKP